MEHGFSVSELSREDDSRCSFHVAIPHDTECVQGHFDDNPMVPAVSILLELVVAQARDVYALGPACGLRRVKFQSALRPRDEVQVSLSREGEEVRFKIARDSQACASGRIAFAEETAAEETAAGAGEQA